MAHRLCENYFRFSKVGKQHAEPDRNDMPIPFLSPYHYAGGEYFNFVVVFLCFHTASADSVEKVGRVEIASPDRPFFNNATVGISVAAPV